MRPESLLLAAFALGALAPHALAGDSPYATTVVDYTPGGGPGIYDATNALGGPQGAGFGLGSLHVTTLGIGGSLTLGFDVTLVDGPGADFTVFENGFFSGGGVFSEAAFVEVSTDGVAFARFPTSYAGPAGPLPTFAGVEPGSFAGMTGGLPVVANVVMNSVSPLDPVVSGGESFDLADLEGHALVTGGAVDLGAIHYVRLLDVVAGAESDSGGTLIWDNGGPTGNADIDAVAVLSHDGTPASKPACDLWIDADDRLFIELGDPDTIWDLDLVTLRGSLSLGTLNVFNLLNHFDVTILTPTQIVFRSRFKVAATGVVGSLSISISDYAGELAGDQVMLQG